MQRSLRTCRSWFYLAAGLALAWQATSEPPAMSQRLVPTSSSCSATISATATWPATAPTIQHAQHRPLRRRGHPLHELLRRLGQLLAGPHRADDRPHAVSGGHPQLDSHVLADARLRRRDHRSPRCCRTRATPPATSASGTSTAFQPARTAAAGRSRLRPLVLDAEQLPCRITTIPCNFVRNGMPSGRLEGYSSRMVADEAIDWLTRHPRSRRSRSSCTSASTSRTSRSPRRTIMELYPSDRSELLPASRQHHADGRSVRPADGDARRTEPPRRHAALLHQRQRPGDHAAPARLGRPAARQKGMSTRAASACRASSAGRGTRSPAASATSRSAASTCCQRCARSRACRRRTIGRDRREHPAGPRRPADRAKRRSTGSSILRTPNRG